MATYFGLGILKSFFSIQSDLAVPLIGPYREVEFFHSNLSPISCTENLSSFLPLFSTLLTSSYNYSSYFSIYQLFYLSTFQTIIYSIYHLFYLSTFLSIYFSIYLLFYISTFLSTFFSIYLLFYLSTFLSIYFSI